MASVPSNLPTPVKITLLIATGASAGYILREMARGSSSAMWVVGIGMCAVIALTGLFVLFQRLARKNKSKRFVKTITPGKVSGGGPAQIRAQREDLRRKFLEGVDKLKDRGIDPYELPWYVVVGESGGGKTELLRRCGAAGAASYGMTDPLQGVGGTLNMNWWFYNRAIILDTAGRLWEDRENPGSLSEWEEFLKLLVKSRTLTPINGLILVVPATSLLRDRADDIDTKTATIVEQLHRMRNSLEIRFPVYIIVSKCDLIPGFREFFDHITQPDLQHQILGWSNRQDIDAPLQLDMPVMEDETGFGPGKTRLEAELGALVDRLAVRRLALLRDPTPAGPSGKRLDDVDGIFAFPDQFRQHVVPTLTQYITKIFATGRYDRKPLFLRGIYFTSSMREGSPLDEDLARLLGKTLDEYAVEEGGQREERAYFLRDLFDQKIFREPGLVSRSATPRRQFRRYRAALVLCAFLGIAVLFGLSLLASRRFRQGVGNDLLLWRTAARRYWETSPSGFQVHAPIVVPRAKGSQDYDYKTSIEVGDEKISAAAYHQGLAESLKHPIEPPRLIKHFVGAGKLSEERRESLHILTYSSVVAPLVEATRLRMACNAVPWSETTCRALAFLLRLELPPPATDSPAFTEEDFDTLMAYVLGPGTDAWKAYDSDPAKETLRRLFVECMTETNQWKSLRLGLNPDQDFRANPAIAKGVETMLATACSADSLVKAQPAIRLFDDLSAKVAAWKSAEEALLRVPNALRIDQPRWILQLQPPEAKKTLADWREEYARFRGFARDCTDMLAQLHSSSGETPQERYQQAVKTAIDKAGTGVVDDLLGQLKQSSVGSDPAWNTFITWLRQNVEKHFRQTARKFNDPETQRQLQALGDHFLRPVPPIDTASIPDSMAPMARELKTLHCAYQIRALMYRAVSDRLPPATSVAPEKEPWRNLDTLLQPIAWLRARAPEAPLVPEAAKASTAMLTVIGADGNHRKAKAFLAAVPQDKQAILTAVQQSAQQTVKLPTIPFSHLHGEAVEPGFSPKASATIVSQWKAFKDTLKTVSPMLEADTIRAEADRLDDVYALYLQDVIGYWSRQIPARVQPVPFASWKEAHTAVQTARAWEIAAGFEDLCKVMTQAKPLFETSPREADHTRWRDLSAELQQISKQVNSAAFTTQCDAMLRRWARLPEDSGKARKEMLAMKAPDLVRDFFVFTPESGNTILHHYWDGLASGFLDVLARDSMKHFEPMIARARTLQRWPLNRPDIGPPLGAGDISQARTLLTALAGTTTVAATPVNIGSGQTTGIPDLDRLLDGLHRLPLPEEDRTWMNRALQLVNVIPANATVERKVTMKLLPPQPGDTFPFSRCWTWVVVIQGGRRVAQINTADVRREIELAWHPGQTLRLEFFLYPEDNQPDKTLTIDGPWAPLKLLFRTADPTAPTTQNHFGPGRPQIEGNSNNPQDASTWRIPVVFADAQGHHRELDMQLTFDQSIPIVWPTR